MMIQEFENLTGIHPTAEEYAVIEDMYYDFDGDKRAFCADFLEKNRMVEALRRVAEDLQARLDEMHKSMGAAYRELNTSGELIARLKAELEREQEWQAYEDESNVKQADYERLDADSTRRELSDDEAADIIAEEFGFERSRITIIHEVPKYEINRHRRLRQVGTYDRKPLFDAWDWSYIRFNVEGNVTMSYEMHDGELQFFRS